MLKIEQLMGMLGMQSSMNSKVNPRWGRRGNGPCKHCNWNYDDGEPQW